MSYFNFHVMFYLCTVYCSIAPGTGAAVSETEEATTMKYKIVFAALTLSLVLNGASVAFAGGKKELVDPRDQAKTYTKSKQTWCDIDPSCNRWGAWMHDVQAEKQYTSWATPMALVRDF